MSSELPVFNHEYLGKMFPFPWYHAWNVGGQTWQEAAEGYKSFLLHKASARKELTPLWESIQDLPRRYATALCAYFADPYMRDPKNLSRLFNLTDRGATALIQIAGMMLREHPKIIKAYMIDAATHEYLYSNPPPHHALRELSQTVGAETLLKELLLGLQDARSMSKKPLRKIHDTSPSDNTGNASKLDQEGSSSVGDREKFSLHQETQSPREGDEPVEDLEDEEIYNPVEILHSYIYAVLGAPTDSFVQKPDQVEEPSKAPAGAEAGISTRKLGLNLYPYDEFNLRAYLYYGIEGIKTDTGNPLREYLKVKELYYNYKLAAYIMEVYIKNSKGPKTEGEKAELLRRVREVFPNTALPEKWFTRQGPTGVIPEHLRQISDFEKRYEHAFCGETADAIRDSVLGMILAAAIETATHTPFSGTLDKTLYVFTGSPAETIMSLLPEEHAELFGRVAKYNPRTKRLTINNMYLKNLLVLMNRWDTAEHILYLLPENVKTQLLSTFIKLVAKRTNKMSKNPSKGSQEQARYAVYYSSTNDRFVLLNWIHNEIKRRNITGVNVSLSPTPNANQYALNLTIYNLQNVLEEIAKSENRENALSLHDVVLRVMTTQHRIPRKAA